MKSIIAFVLALTLVVSMPIVSFGATSNGNDTTISVVGNVNESSAAATSISVDVVWDPMTFTYNEGNPGQWSADEHKYVGVTEGYWSQETATISVTNHSNTALNAGLSFTAKVNGIVGSFTETSGTTNDNVLELASAEGVLSTNAPTASCEFGIDGVAITSDNTALGTITVSIDSVGTVSGSNPDMGNNNNNTTTVGTLDELNTLLAAGGEVKLTKNYDLGEDNAEVTLGTTATLDLAGYSITTSSAHCVLENNGTLTVKDSVGGGKIQNKGTGFGVFSSGAFIVNNGEITGNTVGVRINDGSGLLAGGTFSGIEGATAWSGDGVTLTITGGTFSSDPSEYVDTSRYTVQQSGSLFIVG